MSCRVIDIYNYIDTFAPFDSQCEWDNSGLLVGSKDAEVIKTGFALDKKRMQPHNNASSCYF